MSENTTLKIVRTLSKETQVGLLFCYKALKRFGDDYQQAFEYLMSEEFKNSIHTKKNV